MRFKKYFYAFQKVNKRIATFKKGNRNFYKVIKGDKKGRSRKRKR